MTIICFTTNILAAILFPFGLMALSIQMATLEESHSLLLNTVALVVMTGLFLIAVTPSV
jgi:hypothetical protein